jgi:hypothetical protein
MIIVESRLARVLVIEPDNIQRFRRVFARKSHDAQWLKWEFESDSYRIINRFQYAMCTRIAPPHSETPVQTRAGSWGETLELAVDLRKHSAVFGDWCSVRSSRTRPPDDLDAHGLCVGIPSGFRNALCSISYQFLCARAREGSGVERSPPQHRLAARQNSRLFDKRPQWLFFDNAEKF